MITVGQSPRTDMSDDLAASLSPTLEVVEYGALDGYTRERVVDELAPVGDDEVLVSRMRDGGQVLFSGRLVNGLVQRKIYEAERDGAACTVLMCTGEFPAFEHDGPLVVPMPLFHAAARELAGGRRVAVVVPEESQAGQVEERWRADGLDVGVVCASPYGDPARIAEVARSLRGGGYLFACLDCMGFTTGMRRIVRQESGLPVLLPRTLVASVVSELLG